MYTPTSSTGLLFAYFLILFLYVWLCPRRSVIYNNSQLGQCLLLISGSIILGTMIGYNMTSWWWSITLDIMHLHT
ncbi:MAG: hypothetical protein ACFFED_13890, partial [Candidatus Thorarchaeota archaeon]